MRGRAIGLSVVVVCLAAATDGSADEGGSAAAAQALFDEGVRLYDAGRYDQACPKLEASLKLEATSGTRGLLALCYLKVDRLASAWTTFSALRDRGLNSPDARERGRAQTAADEVARLEPLLARLTIRVAKPAPGGIVTRNGDAVLPATMDVAIPVDAGDHVIVATAPGHRAWQSTFRVANGQTLTVAIPALEQEPAPPAVATAPPARVAKKPPLVAPPPQDTGDDAGDTRRIIGLSVGGAGVVAAAIGVVFLVQAGSKDSDGHANGCDAINVCDNEVGYQLLLDSASAASKARIFLGIGVVALAGGAILYFTAPRARESGTALRIAPSLGGGVVGVTLGGGF